MMEPGLGNKRLPQKLSLINFYHHHRWSLYLYIFSTNTLVVASGLGETTSKPSTILFGFHTVPIPLSFKVDWAKRVQNPRRDCLHFT